MNSISTTRQLVSFFLLAYGLSWLWWLPLYLPALGGPALPVLPWHHAFGSWGPMIASLLLSFRYEGSAGLKDLADRMFRVSNLWCLLAAFNVPFIIAGIALGINYLQAHQWPDMNRVFVSDELPGFNLVSFTLFNLVFYGFGEETGWRGFALPRLQQRFNALWSGVILTVFWAIWHWPLFLYRPGYSHMGIGGVVGWFFSLLTGSLIISWLYNRSRQSILVCALFHATMDVAFTMNGATEQVTMITGIVITLLGLACIPALLRMKVLQPVRSSKVPLHTAS